MRFSSRARNDLTGWAFLAPNVIGFLAFTILPVLFSLGVSFTDWDYTQGFKSIKFNFGRNYAELWGDTWFTDSLRNTVVFAFTVAPATIVIALAVSVLVDRYAFGKKPIRLMLFMPYITNVVAISIVWVMMYAPFGPFTQAVKALGVADPPKWLGDYHWALPAVIIMSIWSAVGYAVMIYTAAIQNLPSDIYEAADLDGASEIRKFFSITIPLLSPTTFFLVITNLISAFQVFGQIMVMTRGGPGTSTHVLGYYIYTTAFSFYRMGYASSIAWILFLILLAITIVQWKGQDRWVYD
jgi:ABC-type sugar transport systems, permease components